MQHGSDDLHVAFCKGFGFERLTAARQARNSGKRREGLLNLSGQRLRGKPGTALYPGTADKPEQLEWD
jgi:hypothetical protein